MSSTKQDPVIVIGGSLVGLSTALFLAYWGVPVTLIEKHPGSSLHPKALGYQIWTMEMLRRVGVAQRLPSSSRGGRGPPRRMVCESLAGKWHTESQWTSGKPEPDAKGAHGKEPEAAKPAQAQTAPSPAAGPPSQEYSPEIAIAIAQDAIEPVMRSRATELGADLRLGLKVISWSQDKDGVKVEAVDSSGKPTTFTGSYLVACDGGRSAVREKLGIQRKGVGHLRTLQSVLFRCPKIQHFLEKGFSQFQIEGRDDGFECFLVTYGDGRWSAQWTVATTDDDESGGPAQVPESLQREIVRKATGLDDLLDTDVELITTGRWDLGGHIADTFQSGRVFLAGDAAHQLPPNRGGYGANTGIADAYNIAWKLAAVLQGKSSPKILETYSQERQPVAMTRHNQIFVRPDYKRFIPGRVWDGQNDAILDDTAMELGQIYRSDGITGAAGPDSPAAKKPDEWQGQPGTRAPHVPLKKDANGSSISTLDLWGLDWTLLTADPSWEEIAGTAATVTGIPCNVVRSGKDVQEQEGHSLSKAFGLKVSGAALVRPDGIIAWRSAEKPEDASSIFHQAFAQATYPVRS